MMSEGLTVTSSHKPSENPTNTAALDIEKDVHGNEPPGSIAGKGAALLNTGMSIFFAVFFFSLQY